MNGMHVDDNATPTDGEALSIDQSIRTMTDPRASDQQVSEGAQSAMMRERRNSMRSKMLGALALLTLLGALFVMQSAAGNDGNGPPTINAATGTIAALNVGTCLTTDGDVFEGDCESLMGMDNNSEVREEITEVEALYATYAYDPKTASDEPRVILEDSDLIQVSISDPGRDKRTGVLIRGESYAGAQSAASSSDLATLIRTDLNDDDIDFDYEDPASDPDSTLDGIVIYRNLTDDNSIIDNSGNVVLNFKRNGDKGAPQTAGTALWQFPPMFVDATDINDVIRFYGFVDKGPTPNNQFDSGTEKYERLSVIKVDEDNSAGGDGGTAPWLSVNASVPANDQLVILAVYYQTSDVENLIGGQMYCDEFETDGTCAAANKNDGEDNVVFTDDEMEDNDALVVKASADGDKESVNLYLKETDRFDGTYQGFLRLTDANGHQTNGTTSSNNWGLEVRNGTGASDADTDVAVLGVESGPVTIEYVDTDGKTQRLRIEIDNQPPAIHVTSPANGSSSDDQTPDFQGTIEDTDSGLAADSFRLVVDNRSEEKNAKFALGDTDFGATGVILKTDVPKLRNANDFMAPNTPMSIGVAMKKIYTDLGDDACNAEMDDSPCFIEADSYDDGDNNAIFDDSVRIDLAEEIRDMEYEIDFQAFVLDQAGNIGFSDSDPAHPRYINDLGTEMKDRKSGGNVFGYYSAHVIKLDEKDPDIIEAQSATGYYGMDGDDMVADRAGVMVVFDGPIDASTVSTDTFSVQLDDESDAEIVDVSVDGKYVFLKLADALASDATPMIDIVQGEKVEDMAGNETFGKEQDAFKAADGITPMLTVTLSGGSGEGDEADEGPDKLTKDQITVHISSDEALQGSPRVLVVCSSIEWKKEANGADQDIDDLIDNRNGAFKNGNMVGETPISTSVTKENNNNKTYEYSCDGLNDFGNGNLQDASSLSRPGENWEYTWQNNGSGLEDGELTVVAYARDRSRYMMGDDTVQNYGSASAEFMLDTVLKSPIEDGGGETQPANDGTSKESRPFILIDFNENTTVTLDTVELDGKEIKHEFERPEANRFVYWPLTLVQGDHEVEVEASDAAGNEVEFELNFKVEERGDFVLNLLAGWNAISVPADPVDTALGSVFTNSEVDTVIGWDTQGWRIAVRRDGVWESSQQTSTLNEVRARYGYWVKSNNFVRQPIKLVASDRQAGGPVTPPDIPTEPGWNFVGVVDADGDQTEGDSGTSLLRGASPVTAASYLRSSASADSTFVRAYTWDATFSRFEVLEQTDTMTIGDGVWVYYGGGIAP